MKIKTNFAAGLPQMLAPVATGVWLSVLLMLAVLPWLIIDAINTGKELAQMQEKSPALKRAGEIKSTESLPPLHELAEIQKQVANLNAIAQSKGLSTLALFHKLENLLPAEAVLTNFHHRAKEREVLLQAQAANAGILSQFLLRLEQDEQFESVVLSQQKELNEDGKVIVQFEIRAKVRA